MSKRMIITIGREFGSCGHYIAEKLAQRLGIAFYDKVLIERAVKKRGLDINTFSPSDEKAPGFFISPYSPTKSDMLYMATESVIKEIGASEESCVIVGRCANAILEGRDDLLRIFIYAPLEDRIATCSEKFAITSDVARKEIQAADKTRKNYYQYFTDYKWGGREGNDLIINSSLFGKDGTVDLRQGSRRQSG